MLLSLLNNYYVLKELIYVKISTRKYKLQHKNARSANIV